MSRQTETGTQWDWAEQLIRPLQNIVERVAEYDPEDDTADFEEMLLEPLSISGGESFTAEDHRGREVLELLQNAQDAAGGLYSEGSRTKTGERAVYIGLSDDGLLVANTGDAFDFSDPDRRKSLRILGHSETSEETIGQFGVGLTSIRSMGEAYEVWTKDPDASGSLTQEHCWRVFCGPRTTLAAIASAAPNARETGAGERAFRQFREEVAGGADILESQTSTGSLQSVPLSAEQIPYFTYPVAMQSWYDSFRDEIKGPLRRRAHNLLTYGHEVESTVESPPEQIKSLQSDVGAFTTAVFVDYEDDTWRDLFEAITGDLPARPDDEAATRIEDDAWFGGERTARITPELLLNLGHIDRLVVERFTDDDSEGGSSIQNWEVFGRDRVENHDADTLPVGGRQITDSDNAEPVDAIEVGVRLGTSTTHDHLKKPANSDAETYSFWDVEFREERTYRDYDWFTSAAKGGWLSNEEYENTAREPIDVSLLFPSEGSGTDLYRPHLYYPIDGVDRQFPYCIHGDFVVQQNRQSLAGGALARNCVVAAEAARLVGRLSEVLASSDSLNQMERASIPWCLLPTSLTDPEGDTNWPKVEDLIRESPGQVADNKPVRALRAAIYEELRTRKNVQVISKGDTPTAVASSWEDEIDVVLHHNPTVVSGIGALYPIVRCASNKLNPERVHERVASATDASIPTETTITWLLRWLTEQAAVVPDDGEIKDREPKANQAGLSSNLVASASEEHLSERARRLRQFVTGSVTGADISGQLVTQWWAVLQIWSEEIDDATDAGSAITQVPFQIGHAVLKATVTIGKDIDGFPNSTLFPASKSGPYLLPCDLLMDDADTTELSTTTRSDHIQLVQVESHETGKDSRRQVLRPESEEVENIAPPAETGFEIYLLSEHALTYDRGQITKATWGTRKYEGPADLYRTLLKDLVSRPTELSLPDIRFLHTVYERIEQTGNTTDTLRAIEGSYHTRDQIKKLASSSAAVDSLKPRVEARRVTVPKRLLEEGTEATARQTRFGDQLHQSWIENHFEISDEDEFSIADSEAGHPSSPPIPIDTPVATVPSSITSQGDETASISQSQIATQLGMLGVSVLPGIQTLLVRGDDEHPDRQSISSWDPTEWTAADDTRLDKLQTVLDTPSGKAYLDLLTTPPFGPGESSNHTTHCNVKDFPRKDMSLSDELTNYDVVLTSWVWIPSSIREEISAPHFAALLTNYGDTLADSILQTGWSCNYGKGNIQSIDTFVPTLLNWQLRTISGWDDITWFTIPAIESLWTDQDEWTLKYAVLDTVGKSYTATAALPRIDPSESPIDESVWHILGVRELDNLNATEAAQRLDALITAAADSEPEQVAVTDDNNPDSSILYLPGLEEIEAWQTLYGTLLGKIGSEIADRGDHMTLEKMPFVNRIPAQNSDGNWVGLPCDELDRAVYYDSIESNWEDRIAALNEDQQYLLRRPDSHFIDAESFEALWESTDANQASARYPEIDRRSTSKSGTAQLREILTDPEVKYGILAATQGQQTLTNDRDRYEKLTETLRRIEPDSSDNDSLDTAWRVTALSSGEGLKFENVEGAPSYAVAYDERKVDPDEPVALADLFMALYQGGNKDSYKLALLGRDVEGKDDVRAELRATDVQELETDLRLSEILLDNDPSIERGDLELPDEKKVDVLREAIAESLRDGNPLRAGTETGLPDAVIEVVNTMCTADSEALRNWAGDLVDPLSTNRTDELRTRLGADLPMESPSSHQLTALDRLEETLSDTRSKSRLPDFNDFLPYLQVRKVSESLHQLVTGIQRLDDRTIPDITSLDDLVDHDNRITWSDTVIPNEESLFPVEAGADTVALSEVVPEDCTWFHFAWWLEAADQSPVETEPAEAIYDTASAILGGESDTHFDKVIHEVWTGGSKHRSSSSNSTFTESSNTTLFDQIDTDVDWSGLAGSSTSDFTVTQRSDGGSGAAPTINQTSDQPRVAELAVLHSAYAALHETDAPFDEIQSQLGDLQSDENNNWRTADGWQKFNDFDSESLPDPEELGKSDAEFPTVAFDITDEGLVGYDILDLTGWAVRRASDVSASPESVDLEPYYDDSTLSPVPVEVKSIDSSNPSFKFSLNQYRRAYDFVTPVDGDSAVPYVLFLVEVDTYEQESGEQRYRIQPYDVIVITCPADLRRLLPSDLSPNEHDTVIDDLILRVLRGGDLIIAEPRS